jgi:hypothetical protein
MKLERDTIYFLEWQKCGEVGREREREGERG